MSFRLPLRSLVLPALLLSAAVAVAWTTPEPSTASAAPALVEGDELEEVMNGLEKNFDAVLASIEKKDAPAALELMSKLQQACISAKVLTPPKLRTVEEKDKAAFMAGFRKEMMVLLKATADLEIALVDGDLAQAKKVTEDIEALQKASHDVYKKMPRKKKE